MVELASNPSAEVDLAPLDSVESAADLGLEELYELAPIGQGGHHAPSFRGRWAATGQRVCVKLATGAFAESLESAFEFLAGASSRALPDPIALLRDAKGRRCLVSTWIDGRNLAQSELRGELSQLAAWVELARALALMHRKGLWHGDPSPANVVLRPDASLSWIDFGLMGHVGGGTPGYLAPESLQGQGGAAADVFAFACLIYRLWTGELVFADLAEFSRWATNWELSLERLESSDLPASLKKLLGQMLRREAAQRPTMEDVVVELEFLASSNLHALSPPAAWKDPGRLTYLGDSVEALERAWMDMGPNADLLRLSGPQGSGRRRTLEELGMRLQAKGHAVQRVDVPSLALSRSLLLAPWLGESEAHRTFVVTGIEASAWIEALGGREGFLAMRALASGRIVMADLPKASSSFPQCKEQMMGRWGLREVQQAVGQHWPSDGDTGNWARDRRRSWSDWLLERFEGRSGAIVAELRRIVRANAIDPLLWELTSASSEDEEQVEPEQSSWTLRSLVRAQSTAAINESAATWERWEAPKQMALANAWAKRAGKLDPEVSRVLLSALLAQGDHEAVMRCTENLSDSDVGARFVRARSLQARQQADQCQALIDALCQDQDPTAQIAGAALALRDRIDRSELEASQLEQASSWEQGQLWARCWWQLWKGYAQLSLGNEQGLQTLGALTLESAALGVIERAPILARAVQLLGNHAWERGRAAQAFAHYEECSRWFQAGGELVGEALAEGNVAALALSSGELSRALRAGERSLSALLAHSAWQPLGALLNNHLRLLELLGRQERARALVERCEAHLEPGGVSAARVRLAMGLVEQMALRAEDFSALRRLQSQVPQRELMDLHIGVLQRGLAHDQAPELRAMAQAQYEAVIDQGSELHLWLHLLSARVLGSPLSQGFWPVAQSAWEALGESASPELSLGWSQSLWESQHASLPGWMQDTGPRERLLDRFVNSAPFADRERLRARFALKAIPSAKQSRVEAPALAQARSAPAFGGLNSLLREVERWMHCGSLESLKSGILDAVLSWADAERGMLVIRDSGGQQVVASEFGTRIESMATSRTLVEGVFESGESVLTIDARSDDRFEHAPSVTHLNLRSVLAAPLRDEQGVFGVIYIDARMRRGAFTDAHLQALEQVAKLAGLVWQQRRLSLALEAQLEDSRSECASLREQLEAGKIESLRLREAQRHPPHGQRASRVALLGESEKIQELGRLIDRYAQSRSPVVVVGELGTGKKSVVRALHAASCSEQSPLVMQDLQPLPEHLQRELLFGGAVDSDVVSLFELAKGGVLYLEGVESLSGTLQKELLELLEEHEPDTPASTVRLVTGFTQELRRSVEQGQLRKELFYRLAVLRLDLPPLRRRLGDLPLLVQHWLHLHERRDLSLSSAALRALSRYAWPGNLRELEQEITRLAVICEERVEKEDLSAWILSAQREGGQDPDDLRLRPRVRALEREIIDRALERSQGNQSHAATLLGVSRFGLQKKLRRWAQDEKEANDD